MGGSVGRVFHQREGDDGAASRPFRSLREARPRLPRDPRLLPQPVTRRPPMSVERVAVIGAGTIGASWAAYFLSRGLHVTASDPAPNAEDFARRYVAAAWPTLERLGGVAPGAHPERLRFERDPARAVADAQFVQESGPEREDVKIALFAELDAATAPETLIVSSSSGLLISRIQSRCRYPERCVLGHPFNPPHLIPLVEVMGGAKTSPEAIAAALEFYRDIGKHPIHIKKEVRGHVANRLQAA